MAFLAKRQFQRSIQREAVKILSPAGLEYSTFEDLSAGGLKLWMDHEMPAQSVISLEFTIRESGKNPTQVKVAGRVVRCIKSKGGFEVGIQFVDLGESMRKIIQNQLQAEDGPF